MSSQIILMTGCASGIGRHLGRVMLQQGHKVLLTDIDLPTLKADAKNYPPEQVLVRCLDVRDPAGWAEMVKLAVETWGRLDVLMNIAGVLEPAYVKDITPQQINLQVDVNIKGVMLGTQAAAAQMIKQGQGHIITIASLAGLSPVPGIGVYSASKFAVRGFSLTAAYELRPSGVAVTVIYPDAVQTPMLDLQLDYEETALTFSGSKVLTVEDIAGAVEKALRTKPMEIAIPRSRGWLAKLAGVLPRAAAWIEPWLMQQGRTNQAKVKARR